jgi:hypothetical protein
VHLAARQDDDAVVADPERFGAGGIHRLVDAPNGKPGRPAGQIREVAGDLLRHVVARRIEKGHFDGSVERGDDLLGRGAGLRGPEEREIRLPVRFGGHEREGEAEDQRAGDAQARQPCRAHAAGVRDR